MLPSSSRVIILLMLINSLMLKLHTNSLCWVIHPSLSQALCLSQTFFDLSKPNINLCASLVDQFHLWLSDSLFPERVHSSLSSSWIQKIPTSFLIHTKAIPSMVLKIFCPTSNTSIKVSWSDKNSFPNLLAILIRLSQKRSFGLSSKPNRGYKWDNWNNNTLKQYLHKIHSIVYHGYINSVTYLFFFYITMHMRQTVLQINLK